MIRIYFHCWMVTWRNGYKTPSSYPFVSNLRKGTGMWVWQDPPYQGVPYLVFFWSDWWMTSFFPTGHHLCQMVYVHRFRPCMQDKSHNLCLVGKKSIFLILLAWRMLYKERSGNLRIKTTIPCIEKYKTWHINFVNYNARIKHKTICFVFFPQWWPYYSTFGPY